MDLTEIKNEITELLYGSKAPQGKIWVEIHKIEDQYKAEIKKLQEDLNLAVDDVIAGKVEITKLRDDLEKIQDSLDDSEAENGNLAEECGRLEADLEAAQRELNDAVAANHSVRVCAEHTDDITHGEGCLVCDLAAALAEKAQIGLSLNLTQRELNAAVAGMRLLESRLADILKENDR